jgi:exopolysaccharide biosynthesis polyprenyl glycosylphosphotransferase
VTRALRAVERRLSPGSRLPWQGLQPRWRRPSRPGQGIPEGSNTSATQRRETLSRRLLGAADGLSAAIAVVIGVTVLGDDVLRPTAILLLPLVLVLSKAIGLYDHDQHVLHKQTLDEAPTLFGVATLYALTLWMSNGFLVTGQLGRDQVLGLWVLLFVSMMVGRTVARRAARAHSPPERIVVLGSARSAASVRRKLDITPGVNAELVGRVPLDREVSSRGSVPVIGDMSTLGIVLVEHDVDRAVIAPSVADSDEILDAVRLVKSLGVNVSLLPRMFEMVGSSVAFDELSGLVLLGVPRYGLTSSSRLLKRAMDLAGVTAALVVLAPVMAMIAAAIKFDSRGPVLFRQRRIGSHDVGFTMLKFRTMVDGADKLKDELRASNEAVGGLFKMESDPRVTRVGRILRRSSLDELPQLFNVLLGHMSLVGPRPLVADEDARVEGMDRRRLTLKPGMTGMWQIFGSARIPLNEMVKIDYLYGVTWSPWLDLKILLRTVPHALARRGL